MSALSRQKTVVLGNEYDDRLRGALLDTLRGLGAKSIDKDWGVGGSQQIETLKVQLRGTLLTVESETYQGLSISGDELVVDEVSELVRKRLSDDK